MKGNKDRSFQVTHKLKINKFMNDVIFVQVIFSRLCESFYNFGNKEKHSMNLQFIEV